MIGLQVTSDLDRLRARFSKLVSEAPALITAGQNAATAAVAAATLPVIIQHTPVGKGPFHDPENNLRAKTSAEAVTVDGDSLIIFRQSATSQKNLDGSGGGHFYVQWVMGGRGPIVAPSAGPYSTGKQALRTPWGLRKSVGPAAANPYMEEAMAEAAASVIPGTLSIASRELEQRIMSALVSV